MGGRANTRSSGSEVACCQLAEAARVAQAKMITPGRVRLGRPGKDESHVSNVSLPDPDPPDLPVPDDLGLRPDAHGRIDETPALVSGMSSSSDSGDSAESQTDIDQTELQRQALHSKVAEKLSKMDVINPEVLRVTPAYRAFERCAQALASWRRR